MTAHPINEALRAAAADAGIVAIDELPERIQSKIYVNPETGCWEWTASKIHTGYGQVWWKGSMRLAHRVVYRILIGPVPDGLELDHVRARGCIYRHCCSPLHLEPVTPHENTMRTDGITAICARKTHCKWGHEFTPENTYITRAGGRKCIACRQAYEMQRRASGVRATYVIRPPQTTHCHKGHERTPENTYIRPNGQHECRICKHAIRVGIPAA